MKKSNRKNLAKVSGSPLVFCTLTMAFAGAFLAPASAATLTLSEKAPATLVESQASVTTTATGTTDPKAVAERDLRSKAMKEAANSYGARSGLLRGSWENREALKKVAPTYDASFNFSTLMLLDQQPQEKGGDGRARLIRPPVIVEARNAFNQLDPRMIREREAVYRIETNVEFAPAPPNWRTYLFRNLGETVAALPHYTLMPRTSEEKAKWDGWVAEGWQAGFLQAKMILQADLDRISRDHEGMILYYDLVAQKILTLPFVAARNDGVTGDANNMNVNDVTLRITVIPAFQRTPKTWVTIATDPTPERVGQSRLINEERAAHNRKNGSISIVHAYKEVAAVKMEPAEVVAADPSGESSKNSWQQMLRSATVTEPKAEVAPADVVDAVVPSAPVVATPSE